MQTQAQTETQNRFNKNKYEEAPNSYYEIVDDILHRHASKSWLVNYPIKILLCKKPRRSRDRQILGTIQKVDEINRAMHGFDFIMKLDKEYVGNNPDKVEALIFHELCHIQLSDDGEPEMVSHDIEEFYEVLKHYGDWKREGDRVVQQLNLFNAKNSIDN